MGKTGSRSYRLWLVVVLALIGAFSQACSDNKGPAGPTFGAGQTGHADTVEDIRVQVAINPNTIELGRRAGVTVLVTNRNGRPLAKQHVQLSTSVGTLDRVDGFTDPFGKFVSTLRVTPSDASAGQTSATVTAFVEGAVGTGTVNFVTLPALFLSPESVTQTNTTAGATCTVGGFTTQFTVSGGVPPYRFSAAGLLPGSSITQSGLYTVGVFTLNADAAAPNDVITVTDSIGNSVSATVTVVCNALAP